MKLIYVIAQGHTGSTLIDCIFGTHPDFISSGELRYLNWQLLRTQNKSPSVAAQDICTCNQDFRDCRYWSKVFTLIKDKSGADLIAEPTSLDIAFFKQFSYQSREGLVPSFRDKLAAYFFRKWVEYGLDFKKLLWMEPQVKKWLTNNWLLYQCMSEAANKPIVVDSSKHLLIALLLQQYRPKDVHLLFIHRSLEGVAASTKRWYRRNGKKYSLKKVIQSKRIFEKRVSKYKKYVKGLQSIDVTYEDFASQPAAFLHQVVKHIVASEDYPKQDNDKFYIDPSQLHLVAGNPMRYKGRQLVTYDSRWNNELTEVEMKIIQSISFK